jgi:hypothetical protein
MREQVRQLADCNNENEVKKEFEPRRVPLPCLGTNVAHAGRSEPSPLPCREPPHDVWTLCCPGFSAPSGDSAEYDAAEKNPRVRPERKGVGQAYQHTDSSACHDGIDRPIDCCGQNANGESAGERLKEHFGRMVSSQRHQHVDDTKGDAEQDSEDEAVHGETLPSSTVDVDLNAGALALGRILRSSGLFVSFACDPNLLDHVAVQMENEAGWTCVEVADPVSNPLRRHPRKSCNAREVWEIVRGEDPRVAVLRRDRYDEQPFRELRG